MLRKILPLVLAVSTAPIASAQLAVPTWRDTSESCTVQTVGALGPQEYVVWFGTFSPANTLSANIQVNYDYFSLTTITPAFECRDHSGELTGTAQCAVSGAVTTCQYSGGVSVLECRFRTAFAASQTGLHAPVISFGGNLTGVAVAGGAELSFKVMDAWELIYGDSFDGISSPSACYSTSPPPAQR